ncbi:MAG: hypothetical protein R3F11_03400 [Verrucomicrobiales bacterium]
MSRVKRVAAAGRIGATADGRKRSRSSRGKTPAAHAAGTHWLHECADVSAFTTWAVPRPGAADLPGATLWPISRWQLAAMRVDSRSGQVPGEQRHRGGVAIRRLQRGGDPLGKARHFGKAMESGGTMSRATSATSQTRCRVAADDR